MVVVGAVAQLGRDRLDRRLRRGRVLAAVQQLLVLGRLAAVCRVGQKVSRALRGCGKGRAGATGSTCGRVGGGLALGGRGRRAHARGARPVPELALREVALLEEHVLPRRRDARVLLLVEDELALLGGRVGRVVGPPAGARAAARVAAGRAAVAIAAAAAAGAAVPRLEPGRTRQTVALMLLLLLLVAGGIARLRLAGVAVAAHALLLVLLAGRS